MSQPISMGTYEAPSFQDGDSLQAQQIVDTPLLVLPHEKKWITKTKFKPEGGDAIILDLRNLVTGEIFLGVMWMNGALVDGFAQYAGQSMVLPVRLQYTAGRNGGNAYIAAVPLDGQDLATAQQWVQAQPTMFADARAERGIGEYQPQGGGLAPIGAAVSAPPVAAPPAAVSAPPVAAPPVAAPPAAAPAAVAAPPAAAPPVAAPPAAAPPAAAPPAAAPAAVAAPPAAAPAAVAAPPAAAPAAVAAPPAEEFPF